MVRDNQLGIMGSETFVKISSLKRMLTLKHAFTILPLLVSFIGEYKNKTIKYVNK